MKETNEILLTIANELKGIREQLDYMNGPELLKDGTRMRRSDWSKMMSVNVANSASKDG